MAPTWVMSDHNKHSYSELTMADRGNLKFNKDNKKLIFCLDYLMEDYEHFLERKKMLHDKNKNFIYSIFKSFYAKEKMFTKKSNEYYCFSYFSSYAAPILRYNQEIENKNYEKFIKAIEKQQKNNNYIDENVFLGIQIAFKEFIDSARYFEQDNQSLTSKKKILNF